MSDGPTTDRREPPAAVGAGRDDAVADVFRRWGYLQAHIDRFGRVQPVPHPELDAVPASQAAPWRAVYCGPVGVEFMHLVDPERRRWVAARMEAPPEPPDRERILSRLATAELFEGFLHARYVGTKRYSLEGSAALIPLLDAALDQAAEAGTEVALLGMSHRGRLTVMVETVRVPAAHLFAGFADFDPRSVLGGGDLKYHLGATGTFPTARGKRVHVHLVSNPSHLEAVDPVLLGRVRARQERLGESGIQRVLGINIHGDAAFAGQGIVAESLNLSQVPGTSVGGVVHVIVNNLIGFTTEPPELHSSRFASDVAKRLEVPIFHVDGQDPEAVERVARMAVDYRNRFGSDVVVDLIGYRRYGHSEVDDPFTTQPLLYRALKDQPRLWEDYGRRIGMDAAALERIRVETEAWLDREQEKGRAMQQIPVLRRLPSYWDAYRGGLYESKLEVDTAVPAARLHEIATAMTRVPEGFHIHPKVGRLLEQRREMVAGKRPVDWGTAEALAFGSLLWEGTPVRLTGQDSRRGTFNQRHAALIDQETGALYVPLAHLHPQQARLDVYNTTLSEAAELGFAYGFSRDMPEALVCWEAQFGDFANGAQVILDTFVSAGEDKWNLLSGVVILLPHGYEGQGPEHSSARLERFLQLAAEDNILVCQPSTASQYFHLLRRQALWTWRKPLVVFTPKGALRAAPACSPVDELTRGRFRWILTDPEHASAERVLVCSGKIAHELRAERQRRGAADVAVITLEQIYPFPEDALRDALRQFTHAREVVWVQEEPANMGALFFVRPLLERLAGGRRVTAVKRYASASPATGSPKAHALEQKALLELAFARFH